MTVEDAPLTAETVLAALRSPRQRSLLLRGFAPMVLAIVLFALMVLLAPSVAPERVIERPVNAPADSGNGATGEAAP